MATGAATRTQAATEVLHLDAVHLRGADPGDDVRGTLTLCAGDVVMLQVTRPAQGTLLADACAGVVHPTRGHITFMQHDWSALDPGRCNALRSIQGRVFHQGNWIQSLDLTDNVLLGQLHHGLRPRAQLLAEAARLARRFGLPGLPVGAASRLDPDSAQRLACVRAFLGAPRLVVLEHPTAGAAPHMLAPLVNTLREACDRGAAILWITPSQRVWRNDDIPVTRRLRIARGALVDVAIE
jgi:phospholipid/cholesterol/gamma-HCH transport system ATP-binding protein